MNVTLALSLLASSGAELPLPTKVPGMARDTLIVLIAVSAVGLVLLGVLTVWVKSRRSRQRHHRHHRYHRSDTQRTEASPAETGGLPPPRQEGQVPPGL